VEALVERCEDKMNEEKEKKKEEKRKVMRE
jgi:hypothetical protein